LTCLLSGALLFVGACKTKPEVLASVTTPVPSQTVEVQGIIPYIPPSYYACLQVNLDDLLKNYFTHYGNLDLAEQAYDGQIFVFNSIRVMQSMIVDGDSFVVSNAQFIAMQPGAVAKLKVGDLIDVVGINRGPMPEAEGKPLSDWFDANGAPLIAIVSGWLYFTDCIFLPSGSVVLPAPGAPAFVPLY
jgi:hypothetical protein